MNKYLLIGLLMSFFSLQINAIEDCGLGSSQSDDCAPKAAPKPKPVIPKPQPEKKKPVKKKVQPQTEEVEEEEEEEETTAPIKVEKATPVVPTKPVETKYTLIVDADVVGAEVFANDQFIGKTPLNVPLPSAVYEVVIKYNDQRVRQLLDMRKNGYHIKPSFKQLKKLDELKKALLEKEKEVDSDLDGVWNGKDRCPNTPKGVTVDEFGCPPTVSEYRTVLSSQEGVVNFDHNDFKLRPTSYKVLDKLSYIVTEEAGHLKEVIIEGHADYSEGNDNRTLRLSQQRAQSVVDAFIKRGVPKNKIQALGKGKQQPAIIGKEGETEEGMAKNRRVEIIIRKRH